MLAFMHALQKEYGTHYFLIFVSIYNIITFSTKYRRR